MRWMFSSALISAIFSAIVVGGRHDIPENTIDQQRVLERAIECRLPTAAKSEHWISKMPVLRQDHTAVRYRSMAPRQRVTLFGGRMREVWQQVGQYRSPGQRRSRVDLEKCCHALADRS